MTFTPSIGGILRPCAFHLTTSPTTIVFGFARHEMGNGKILAVLPWLDIKQTTLEWHHKLQPVWLFLALLNNWVGAIDFSRQNVGDNKY
ncbi:hypothetical protein [Yoonia maritima]|uniref:hypothetical protein n=1 Tax=Yoonia maritima TaxID=1435347 RepID=UPI0013A680E2|nr:hypothetical protein [Yoonia maritima]